MPKGKERRHENGEVFKVENQTRKNKKGLITDK